MIVFVKRVLLRTHLHIMPCFSSCLHISHALSSAECHKQWLTLNWFEYSGNILVLDPQYIKLKH